MKADPLEWCSISCVCQLCLNQDLRIERLTRHNVSAEVKIRNE